MMSVNVEVKAYDAEGEMKEDFVRDVGDLGGGCDDDAVIDEASTMVETQLILSR
jgi:hypothetical protein